LTYAANIPVAGTPFMTFECQSAVLSCCFSPFMPNVIVGGTYSGEVVLWDNRNESKRTPVQRSTITTEQGHASHTHPVDCLDIVGTQNAHFLVTASTDAKMCNWDLDTLTAPQDTLELQSGTNKQLAATAFSFPANDSNNFVLGTEDGSIYQCSRHGSKAGVGTPFSRGIGMRPQATPLPSHHGPVTVRARAPICAFSLHLCQHVAHLLTATCLLRSFSPTPGR
jgi:hypothetical protein